MTSEKEIFEQEQKVIKSAVTCTEMALSTYGPSAAVCAALGDAKTLKWLQQSYQGRQNDIESELKDALQDAEETWLMGPVMAGIWRLQQVSLLIGAWFPQGAPLWLQDLFNEMEDRAGIIATTCEPEELEEMADSIKDFIPKDKMILPLRAPRCPVAPKV